MQQTLVERGLCPRQPTAKENLLVFARYYCCERTEQVAVPGGVGDLSLHQISA